MKVWPDSPDKALGKSGEPTLISGVAAYEPITDVIPLSEAAGHTMGQPPYASVCPSHRAGGNPGLAPLHNSSALYIASEEDPFPPPVETHRQEFGRMAPNGEFHVSKAPSKRDFRQRFPEEVSAQISFFRWSGEARRSEAKMRPA